MSDRRIRRPSLPRRRATALGAVLVGLLVILGGGTLLGQGGSASQASRITQVGRTTTICTTSAPPSGEPAGKTEVFAVSVREAPSRTGLLTASTLKSKPSELKLTEPGKGGQLSGVTAPVVISADGSMASASSAVIVGDVLEGPEVGLKAAPCLTPGTSHWFSGLGATDADRTDLILSNPDDAQAQVDLRFYGRSGRVAVPGSPGVVIRGHESRTVSLSSLVEAEGALSVAVQASQGRVTAVAKRMQTNQLKAAGVDWQIPSASPSTAVVIPAVPEDDGGRTLVVTNPSNTRAGVAVQILGFQGPYEPKGAASLDVPPESTATVDLGAGLAGEAGSVKLTSNVPVTGSVISTSRRGGAGIDLAVQSAAVPLIGNAVSALATSNLADSVLIVSNTGDRDAQITFDVLSYDGVTLRTANLVLGPNSTATRRLNSPAPSYVVVKVPAGSSVVGGVVLTQPDRDVAGLATIPLGSPDLASRAPATRADSSVGH
jgi:Family of unknown function (DUF5719)